MQQIFFIEFPYLIRKKSIFSRYTLLLHLFCNKFTSSKAENKNETESEREKERLKE